jgi:beta-lactamase class A
MLRRFLPAVTLAVISPFIWGADPAISRLEAEMKRVAQVGGGMVGATAIHAESGRVARLNATERFPMASTFKVPIAVQVLHLVDQGKERLDRMITIEPPDIHPGSGTLSELFNKPGVALSIRNLLELMLLISDNTATDILLREAGGPEAVNQRLEGIGITGIRVDRPTALLIADWVGVPGMNLAAWSQEAFRRRYAEISEPDRRAASEKAEKDPRDTATPEAMARLLVQIHRKELHKPESADLLVDIMRRCQSGPQRLKGMLPAGTVVAHKTGTIGRSVNDVGIIDLPSGTGTVALAVFLKESEKPVADRERALAEIARTVHDFFLFQ